MSAGTSTVVATQEPPGREPGERRRRDSALAGLLWGILLEPRMPYLGCGLVIAGLVVALRWGSFEVERESLKALVDPFIQIFYPQPKPQLPSSKPPEPKQPSDWDVPRPPEVSFGPLVRSSSHGPTILPPSGGPATAEAGPQALKAPESPQGPEPALLAYQGGPGVVLRAGNGEDLVPQVPAVPGGGSGHRAGPGPLGPKGPSRGDGPGRIGIGPPPPLRSALPVRFNREFEDFLGWLKKWMKANPAQHGLKVKTELQYRQDDRTSYVDAFDCRGDRYQMWLKFRPGVEELKIVVHLPSTGDLWTLTGSNDTVDPKWSGYFTEVRVGRSTIVPGGDIGMSLETASRSEEMVNRVFSLFLCWKAGLSSSGAE